MNKTETIPLCELNYHVIKTNCMKKKQITTPIEGMSCDADECFH